LKLQSYKTTVVHALKEYDLVARINFCNWFLWSVHDGEFDPQLVFFSDEAWFSLCGGVNSQNNQYWSAENPRLIHELPLHDEEIGVSCAISACRIIRPVIYDDSLNAARYVNNILSPFFTKLTEEERLYGVFQQDSATAYMAHMSLEALQVVFSGRVISCGLWPPCSPDLTPCDSYLWGSLKDKVCKSNPHILEELRSNIRCEIQQFLGKNSRELRPMCFAGTLSAFGQEGSIFSICCSTGEFLLHFLKVILTVISYH
jgi:hypothetical protein